ncbi:2Fe-2S iron-sulfur cluster binding domain-containing protein [Ruminococcaceae bacterium OttesenSCG-928-L11]|nr:2Fe-2S iron-sulfur cluster binding domain-containing protein [Ruminococcaceae bacterium OttesenSCG-928-L11]
MAGYVTRLEGVERINTEIAVLGTHNKRPSLYRGQTQAIIDRLHPKQLNLEVSEIIDRPGGAKTLRFVSQNGYLPVFQAGQYINIFVEIDGVRTSRPYSISSSPRQRGYYDLTIAPVEQGFVSGYLLKNVQVGDQFESSAPSGEFHYNPAFHSKNMIMLAGGSGITPFMSMSREVLDSGIDRNLHLIYGCRNESCAVFLDELKDMEARHSNFTLTVVASAPETGYKGKTGFISSEVIREALEGFGGDATFYICGPQAMYEFTRKELDSLNIPQRKIRQEMFGARRDIQNEPGWPQELDGSEVFKITLDDGRTIDGRSGESLLTALERAGVRVNVCCRSGVCSLCRVKLVKGKVFMPEGVLLRYTDEQFGYIHSCQAYPIGDVEIAL